MLNHYTRGGIPGPMPVFRRSPVNVREVISVPMHALQRRIVDVVACKICFDEYQIVNTAHTSSQHYCSKCKTHGHSSNNCQARNLYRCDHCKSEGNPEMTDHTSSQHCCSKCGENGHSSRDCSIHIMQRCAYCEHETHITRVSSYL